MIGCGGGIRSGNVGSRHERTIAIIATAATRRIRDRAANAAGIQQIVATTAA